MTVLVSVTVSLRTLKLDYNSNAKYWNRAVASSMGDGGGGDAVVIIEAERRKEEKDVGDRRGCSSLRVDSLFEVVAVILLLQGLLARRRRRNHGDREPSVMTRQRKKKV